LNEGEKNPARSLFFQGLPRAIRVAAGFIVASRADFAMRGFVISFETRARIASKSFLAFFFIEHP
jgi:hypothetical protein